MIYCDTSLKHSTTYSISVALLMLHRPVLFDGELLPRFVGETGDKWSMLVIDANQYEDWVGGYSLRDRCP